MIAVGTVLHDTYRIERPLGRGAMGSVYRAAHLRVPRPYAIKVLESIGNADKAISRFRRIPPWVPSRSTIFQAATLRSRWGMWL